MPDIRLELISEEERQRRAAEWAAKERERKKASAKAVQLGQHWRITPTAKERCPDWPDEVVVTERNDFLGDTLCSTRVLKPKASRGKAHPMGTIVLYDDYECLYDPNKAEV